MKNRVAVYTFAGAVGIAAPAIQAQQFKDMGDPPPGPFCTGFILGALSDDGIVYGGLCGFAGMWSLAGGYQVVQSLPPSNVGEIDSVNVSGTLFGRVQLDETIVPALWTNPTQVPELLSGFPVGWNCFSASCNYEGTVVTGTMTHTQTNQKGIYIWREGKGVEVITQFPNGKSSIGLYDLNDSGDTAVGGSVAGGITVFEAVRWTEVSGFEFHGDLPGGTSESAYSATDATGRVAVGDGTTAVNQYAATRWTEAHGLVNLGFGPVPHVGNISTGLTDVDASGFVGAGQAASGGAGLIFEAVLWNPLDGLVSVEKILIEEYGLANVAGWDLHSTQAISPNGRYIAGIGVNPQGVFETWWAEVIPFCYADCDRDKQLTFFDFLCYINHFDAEDIYSNCNNDGAVDFFDFLCFINKWHGGCP